MTTATEPTIALSRSRGGVLAAVYALYFVTGAAALVFETLWIRQFVLVFGNSSYAISVVLAAFMGGLGIGAWFFGRIVDRGRDPLRLFALIEGGVIVWALLIPGFLGLLARVMPAIVSSAPNLALESVIRFAFSFAVLLVPCVLMGGTLPVLTRFVVDSREAMSTRLSVLYGLNTLGAAAGCAAAGFYLLETFGQAATNRIAVAAGLLVIIAALVLRASSAGADSEAPADAGRAQPARAEETPAADAAEITDSTRKLLLFATFVSGFATMAVEVLWVRYLVFIVPNNQYSFTSILAVVLLGLAAGSLLYNALIARRRRQLLWLAAIEMALGPVMLAALMLSAHAAMGGGAQSFFTSGPLSGTFFKAKLGAAWLAALTVFAPAALIGMVFPLVAAAYTRSVSAVGRGVGKASAVNTLGCILGSLAPLVFLVGWLGIRNSIFVIAALNSALGVLIMASAVGKGRRFRRDVAAAAVAAAFVVAWGLIPPDLTQELFYANPEHKGRHQETAFYREGPTATVMVVQNGLTGFKEVFIGGIEEVPTAYTGRVFFKVFGSLGPLLHPDPKDVLVLCLGGGVTAGTVIQHPQVERVECVDLVRDMVSACRELSDVNNNLVESPKFKATIEDARNYLVKRGAKFPVIVCDSTHPKSPDSWPLYTTEFYEAVKGALADDGMFLQWLPAHAVGVDEYKVLAKTFQSVFPHASVWYVAGYDETGDKWLTTMLLATPEKLSIDLDLLKSRLAPEPVRSDLAYWNLETPEGMLSSFLCGEDTLRAWTGGVPVNTDDHPYTQYKTRFTGSTAYGWPEIAAYLESVQPYVRPGGDPAEYSRVTAALDRSLAARKALLRQGLAEALKISPSDRTLLTLQDNLRRGEEYLKSLAVLYRDDDRMLADTAGKMLAACVAAGKNPADSFDGIASVYTQALAFNPGNVPALVGLGTLCAAAGKADEAQTHLGKAVRLAPKDADALLALGMFLSDSGESAQAISCLRRALDAAPDSVNILNALAIALNSAGEADEAASHLARAVALSGQSMPGLYYNLGCANAMRGDMKAAVSDFALAVARDPSSSKYRLSLGVALMESGGVGDARREFEQVLAVEPGNAEARSRLGAILLGEGRVDDALVELRAARAAFPDDPVTTEYLGRALALKRDYPNAIGILRQGMNAQPTVGIARELAWLLATCPADHLRNASEAVALAESIRRAGDSSAEAFDTLAAACAEAGAFGEAVKAAEQALALAARDSSLADQIRKRLDLYRSGRPYRGD